MNLRQAWVLTKRNMSNRFEYAKRDINPARIIVIRERIWSATTKRFRTTFYVLSTSNPQYSPYIGMTHQYEVMFSFKGGVSFDSEFTSRVGTQRHPTGNTDFDIANGINPDFVYRQDWVRKNMGILFGRSVANRPPRGVNPGNKFFFTKHEIAVIHGLMIKGYLI